jgi:DNA transposition AAA+ family ATPase
MAAQGDELGAALVLLGGGGLALVLSLKTICAFLRRREVDTGRRISAEEFDALMATVQLVPALEERMAGVERTVEGLAETLEELLRRARQRRATDG